MRVVLELMSGRAALYNHNNPRPYAHVRAENVLVTLDGEESHCIEADDEENWVLALDVIKKRGPVLEFAVDEFGVPKYQRRTGRVRIKVQDPV